MDCIGSILKPSHGGRRDSHWGGEGQLCLQFSTVHLCLLTMELLWTIGPLQMRGETSTETRRPREETIVSLSTHGESMVESCFLSP